MDKKFCFKIGDKWIGRGKPVFVIAEISANHKQDFKRAELMIKTAANCGVDAVKLQTYTPDTLTIDCSKKWFVVKNANPSWDGKTLYELYKKAYMPWEWQPKLKKIAEDCGIILFSSAYDETSVDFLEKMHVPAYKIASFEINNINLLKKIARTKKPVIISKGMASLGAIKLAISILKKNGAKDIALLHCVSAYPTKPKDMNLATIPDIKKKFKVVPGLSDHSLGISIAIASVAVGACVIEKHFTLKRGDGGLDSSFSIEPKELKQLVQSVREVENSIGGIRYGLLKNEKGNIAGLRSLFVIKNIKAGQEFTLRNVHCIRPGYGLNPSVLPKILGRKAVKNIECGTPLCWDLINKKS
ncbi:MAG: pseudaminic acid synthase [Candidatus Staskawiczbacteria bacterium]|jgi:pseudaminic acid synthase